MLSVVVSESVVLELELVLLEEPVELELSELPPQPARTAVPPTAAKSLAKFLLVTLTSLYPILFSSQTMDTYAMLTTRQLVTTTLYEETRPLRPPDGPRRLPLDEKNQTDGTTGT